MAELWKDPVGAAREHRRQAVASFVTGAILGGLTVLASWFH